MAKTILVLGGARSGKSQFAVELARSLGGRTAFVATLQFRDEEMEERIRLHRQHRPGEWQTVEEGKNVDKVVANLHGLCDVVLIDCLTNLVSNLLMELQNIEEVRKRVHELIETIRRTSLTTIIVSNEVGGGLVPETPLGRQFRDVAGIANQLAAKCADEVYLMCAGIPLRIK